MRTLFALGTVVSAIALLGGFALAGDEAPNKDVPLLTNERFVEELAHANKAEVKIGQLAADRAASQVVKDFGMQMADDHTKAYDELAAIAKTKGIRMPSDPSEEQKKTYDRLEKLRGKDFDREFSSVMLKDHERVVSIVERYTRDGADAELKAWADSVLPTLKHHLDMARDMEKKIAR